MKGNCSDTGVFRQVFAIAPGIVPQGESDKKATLFLKAATIFK